MKKRILWLMPLVPCIFSFASIVSCSNKVADIDSVNNNNLLLEFIKNNKIGTNLFENDVNIQEQYNPYLNDPTLASYNDVGYNKTQANQLNMFKILLNEHNNEPDNQDVPLDFIFSVKEVEVANTEYTLSFSFDYENKDTFNQLARPYLTSNKDAIVIPVKVLLLSKKSKTILASKYVDIMLMRIIDTKVNNLVDLGFNSTNGKALIFENKAFSGAKAIKFIDLPKMLADPYIDLNYEFNQKSAQSRVIYNKDNIEKWKGKSFEESKSISNSFINPPSLITPNRTYSYSIFESFFDQDNWNYPRFTLEFKLQNQNNLFNEEDVKKYGLIFYKRYSYVDFSYKFANPTKNEISSAIDRNNKLATELSTLFGSTNLKNPTVNFSTSILETHDIEKVVEWFNQNKNGFIAPQSYGYNVINGGFREINFEIEKIEVDPNQKDIMSVTTRVKVGKKELQGTATYVKKFNTKTWKWE